MGYLPVMHSSISAGFPSPAQDYVENNLDINAFLIHHPHASFILKVEGNSMQDAKIFSGDYLIVDKSIEPRVGKIVIAEVAGGFTCKELQKNTQGNMYLKAHNIEYDDIYPDTGEELVIRGVVIGKFNTL